MLANSQTKNYPPSLILKAKAELELRRRRSLRDAELEVKRKVWREHPDLYAKERLNLDLTGAQIQILYSILKNRRTAVKAHHSLGKTFIAAVALLWWIDCWQSHIGYITAPTWGQALGLTFKQAKRLAMINRLDFEILDSGLIRDRDRFKQTERFIKALNAANGEGFQGEHTAPILIIVEEAVGVPNYIFDAMEGLMTDPRCRWCLVFNPTDEATKAGELCEAPNVETFSFSALDHPNITAELNCEPIPFAGAVSLQWLYEQIDVECEEVDTETANCFEFYGLEEIKKALEGIPVSASSRRCFYKPTAFFQGRVLGEFPTEASNKVIPSGWLNDLPRIKELGYHPLEIGCDVARFGDDRTTIAARQGSVLLSLKECRKFDSFAIVTAIQETLAEIGGGYNTPIKLDVTGGLGTGPYDILISEGYDAIAVNSSEKAFNEEQYPNRRSELWFDLQDRVREKRFDMSRIPQEQRRRLIKELSTPMYLIRKGRKTVEDKSEIKKRLGYSPDLADAVNLAFSVDTAYAGSYETGVPYAT